MDVLPAPDGAVMISIGQKVMKIELDGIHPVPIQISHLCPGIYFIRITSDEKSSIAKFIKQ